MSQASAADSTYPGSMTVPARRRPTVEEVVELLERGEGVELIDGELVQRTMARPAHGGAQTKVGEVLGPFNRQPGGPRGPGGWWIFTEVEVLYRKTEEVFRHDLVGFRRDRHAARPSDFPVGAVPDWVCEILSTSTARYDLVKKNRTLHTHGVAHYWIVDPEHETLAVHRHHADGYLAVTTGGVGDVVRAEPFDAIEIDVGELFGRER
jgi:Uma2 family endonuclease